jgi:hypothetical protein
MSNRDDIPGMETITLPASVFAKRVCYLMLTITIGLLGYLVAGPSQEIKHLISQYVYWYCCVALVIIVFVVISAFVERASLRH